LGIRADAARGVNPDVPAEATGEVEDLDIVEVDSVIVEHDREGRRRLRLWLARVR